jgi:hypothetical protein
LKPGVLSAFSKHCTVNLRSRRLLAFGLAIAVILILLSPSLWQNGRELLYRHALKTAFEGELEYVEFQPNTDWPKRRITERDRLDAVEAWLLGSAEVTSLRSAPPAPVCDMRFQFKDGRVEIIPHSPFREPLGDSGSGDVRGDVCFQFRDYHRSGSTTRLAAILDRP